MGLTLKRKIFETIILKDDRGNEVATIRVTSVSDSGQVGITIDAPKSIIIHRGDEKKGWR